MRIERLELVDALLDAREISAFYGYALDKLLTADFLLSNLITVCFCRAHVAFIKTAFC